MNNLYLLASVMFLAMLSPGPDFIIITKNSLRYSKQVALFTAMGIVSGCFIHAFYSTLGLALIIAKSVLLFAIIKYLGACYLIYLGIKALLSKEETREEKKINTSTKMISLREAFFEGFFTNLLNPKLAVFLISLFTQFITIDATLADKAVVGGLFVLEAAIYWPMLVILLQTQRVISFFTNYRQKIDRICGSILIALGVKVALSKD